MIWSTHLMAGLSTLWLLEAGAAAGVLPATSAEQIPLMAGAAALGALLPDLDAAQSKIKHLSVSGIKPFFLPSQMIFHRFGHRTFLHSLSGLAGLALFTLISLVALIAVAVASFPEWQPAFAGWRGAVALIAGYASHLALDACNPSGIPLHYPDRKRYHLLPQRWRITTGSALEEMVFALFSLAALLYFLLHLLAG